MDISLKVNGVPVRQQVPANKLLIDFVREDCGLTGTHQGCDTAQCGACTVIVDGKAAKSCNLLTLQVNGCAVTTIEGVAGADEPMHLMQQAFAKHHALQCGYCTPGFVMRAIAMADESVAATPDAVRHALAGNICRCTGYQGITDAVCEGLLAMRLGKAAL